MNERDPQTGMPVVAERKKPLKAKPASGSIFARLRFWWRMRKMIQAWDEVSGGGTARYKFAYGQARAFSFSAPAANTQQDMADILQDFVNVIDAMPRATRAWPPRNALGHNSLKDAFERHGETSHSRFEDIEEPLHPRHDLCAMLYLARLVKGSEPMVARSNHDEIIFSVDPRKLGEMADDADVLYLVRCGVRLLDGQLRMFV